jgi:hypothetical protein
LEPVPRRPPVGYLVDLSLNLDEICMDQPPSKLRVRFSLLTLLLATAAICLGVSHWHTSRQLASARAALRKLRDEVGYLSIDDPTKFHAVALESEAPNTWQWRLFVPQGARYQWNIACDQIPQNSPPARAGITAISYEPYWETANEVVVTARLREADAGNWTLSVTSKIGDSKHQMSGATLTIPPDKINWMSTVSVTDGQVIGSRGTAVRDPDGPIILLQRRAGKKQPDGSYRPSDEAMPGFMIWLSKG